MQIIKKGNTMKRILCKLFKKRYATGGIIKRRLYITKEDYDRVYTAIEKEYEEAKARQNPCQAAR